MLFFLKYAKSEDLSLTHKEFKKQVDHVWHVGLQPASFKSMSLDIWTGRIYFETFQDVKCWTQSKGWFSFNQKKTKCEQSYQVP